MQQPFADFNIQPAGWLRYAPALAFTLLMGGGLWASVTSLLEVAPEKWRAMNDWRDIAQGESTKRFTAQLNDHFVLAKPFARTERAVNWNLFDDSGASVRAGCRDWFFLSEELNTFPQAQENAAMRARLVSKVGTRLQEQGIHLLVAVVPDKTRIEASHLCGLHRSTTFEPRVLDWLAQLSAAHIDALDLAPTMRGLPGERYYRTDTHWNEAGARAAATAIIAHLRSIGKLAPAENMPADTAIQSTIGERPGDLLRVANFEGLPMWARPPVERTAISTVAPVAAKGDDLFGDSGLPEVALVGTSFSLRGNFVPFLSWQLGAPVANLAKDGSDFDGAASTYLHSKEFAQQAPKIIVWEVPERMLQKPLKDSERKWLAQLESGKL